MNAKIMSGWRLLLGCWLLLAGQGMAHPILQNPMWIEVGPDLIKVKLYVSLRELSVVQGLPIAADGTVDGDLAAETAPRHSAYVLDHLSFRADGQPLTGKVSEIAPPKLIGKGVEAPDRAHFIYRLEYPLARPPAQVSLSHTMVQEFPSAPGVPWDLSYTYRFGPPDATPLEFGSITRGAEVSYKTGFAQPAGTVAVVEKPVSALPQLIRIALFGAAFGLGVGRRDRWLGRLLPLIPAVLLGWGVGAGLGWKMPGFLAAALGGIGILLLSVDNIHRPLADSGRRRGVLAVLFSAAAGWAGWSARGGEGAAAMISLGESLAGLALGYTVGSVFAQISAARPVADGTVAKYPWIQWASLLICLGGLLVLFEGLGIRPWAYWLKRTGG